MEGINLQHVNQSSQISSKLEGLFIKEETDNVGTISLNKETGFIEQYKKSQTLLFIRIRYYLVFAFLFGIRNRILSNLS